MANWCTRCGRRIGIRDARVIGVARVWCGACAYDVEHRGEPVDSEHARQERTRREAERKARAAS